MGEVVAADTQPSGGPLPRKTCRCRVAGAPPTPARYFTSQVDDALQRQGPRARVEVAKKRPAPGSSTPTPRAQALSSVSTLAAATLLSALLARAGGEPPAWQREAAAALLGEDLQGPQPRFMLAHMALWSLP